MDLTSVDLGDGHGGMRLGSGLGKWWLEVKLGTKRSGRKNLPLFEAKEAREYSIRT